MRSGSRAGLTVLAVFWGLAVGIALLAPRLDLRLISFVFEAQGGRFVGTGGIWAPLYFGVPYLLYAVAGIALIAALASFAGWPVARRARHGAFVVLGTLLAHVLVIEALLKNHWGRARPRDLVEFGGTANYSPPLVPSDQCISNCAFASGHAGAAFTLIAVALVVPARWRIPAVAAALCFGALSGLMRVLQGAHFPFDSLFAGLIVCTAALLLDRWLPGRASPKQAVI